MNITFNWNRFLCLCKREFSEGRAQWLRWYIVLAAVMLGLSRQSFLFGVIICIASALLMPGISGRQKRVFYLMIPASPLEKLLSRYVYVMSLILIAFPLAGITANLGLQLFKYVFFHRAFSFDSLFSFLPVVGVTWETVLTCLTLQVVFMLGSMIWLKNSFFKTLLFHVLFGIILFIAILSVAAVLSYHAGGISGPSEIDRLLWSNTFFRVMHVLMVLFFYVLCYFRFRELGIVHKLRPLTPTLRILLGCYALLLIVVCVIIISWFSGMQETAPTLQLITP